MKKTNKTDHNTRMRIPLRIARWGAFDKNQNYIKTLVYLKQISSTTGFFIVDEKQYLKDLNISKSTLFRHIKKFKEIGWLRQDNKNTNNHAYFLNSWKKCDIALKNHYGLKSIDYGLSEEQIEFIKAMQSFIHNKDRYVSFDLQDFEAYGIKNTLIQAFVSRKLNQQEYAAKKSDPILKKTVKAVNKIESKIDALENQLHDAKKQNLNSDKISKELNDNRVQLRNLGVKGSDSGINPLIPTFLSVKGVANLMSVSPTTGHRYRTALNKAGLITVKPNLMAESLATKKEAKAYAAYLNEHAQSYSYIEHNKKTNTYDVVTIKCSYVFDNHQIFTKFKTFKTA